MPAPATVPGFFHEVRFAHVRLAFRVRKTVSLPPLPGSALRGAMGYVVWPALCRRRPFCEAGCREPAGCPAHLLLERNRDGAAQDGENLPKLTVLEPPLPRELVETARDGVARPPYRVDRPERAGGLPRLATDEHHAVEAGETLTCGLTLVGQAAGLWPLLREALRSRPFECARGELELAGAADGLGEPDAGATPAGTLQSASLAEVAAGEAGARRVRVHLETPLHTRWGDGPCLTERSVAGALLPQCLARVVKLHQATRPHGAPRLPWVETPPGHVHLARARLFHYVLPRYSHRAGRWMRFDGAVGWLELEGELDGWLPYLRAAEVLHVGQKTTFGLGRIRVEAG